MRYILFFAITLLSFSSEVQDKNPAKIQIALLLDTSNSMDGLIDQAKGKLWSIVNEFSRYEKNEQPPILEIALFEYGNNTIYEKDNWIRQITPFTTDLDFISEKLFELSTNGGDEYCGAVIHEANQKLEWTKTKDDLRLIFIAGNEGFDQGNFNYRDAGTESVGKDIAINTIFCGDYEEGIRLLWKEGASIGHGKYLNINQDRQVTYIKTPYDSQIEDLNKKLNQTYLWYGDRGDSYIANQAVQDKNAFKYGKENVASRTIAKSSANYFNAHWDVVDAVNDGTLSADDLAEEENIDPELKDKTAKEIEVIINQKKEDRLAINQEIKTLGKKRSEFISKNSDKNENTLDNAIKHVVKELATKKGFKTTTNE